MMLEVSAEAEREKARARASRVKWQRQQALLVMAFIGSTDDLTLYVPMLVGKGFGLVELISGSLCATCVIIALCLSLGSCKLMADFLSNIPLAPIVIVFAVILL